MIRPEFPFSAIVGNDDLRLALLLNAVDPAIGGVLIHGDKGTAKSTAVRALAALLPPITVRAGCPGRCDPSVSCTLCHADETEVIARPVIELPLGASEDRVTGTLDLERTLATGERHFEPGLLAAANRGVLYIDEVNLLPDHLVDLLLDVAASGRNRVEREGVSVEHPASFILAGTMNEEEGELRPQLLDRFGLTVSAQAPLEAGQRAEVVRRRVAFDSDPAGFARRFEKEQQDLATRLARAAERAPAVTVAHDMLTLAVDVCLDVGVDGLRPDITLYRAAAAHAALHDRGHVCQDDIYRVAPLVLAHRRRRPFDTSSDAGSLEEQLDQHRARRSMDPDSDDPGEQGEEGPGDGGNAPRPSPPQAGSPGETPDPESAAPGGPDDAQPDGSGEPPQRPPDHLVGPRGRLNLRLPQQSHRRHTTNVTGRRGAGAGHRGRVRSYRMPSGRPHDIAPLPTLLATALRRLAGTGAGFAQAAIRPQREDIRVRERETPPGRAIFLLIDGSGSMGARDRMADTKAALLGLVHHAYELRDMISIHVFRDEQVDLVLQMGRGWSRASTALANLPTGGRTPLALALETIARQMAASRKRSQAREQLFVLATDGRHRDDKAHLDHAISQVRRAAPSTVVIDTESGFLRLHRSHELARRLGAEYMSIADAAIPVTKEAGTGWR